MIFRILIATLFLLLSCCANKDAENSLFIVQGIAMTMPYKILVEKQPNENNERTINQVIHATFHEIDTIYNKWNPYSELSKINNSSGIEKHSLSDKLYTFLLQTELFVKKTDGKFDPTIEPVQKLWKENLIKGRTPKLEDIASASRISGWDKISLENQTIKKQLKGVEIDLGGIVKGYAIDLIVERLVAAGYGNIFVEWGGEIRAAGHHPDGRPWKIYISRLGDADPSRAIEIVEIHDQAIATSGDYLQQWTVGKQTFCHIIDPQKLSPLELTYKSIASVTVAAKTCMEADVLATTAMLFSTVEEAENWAVEQPDAKFWIFSREKLFSK